MTAVTPIEPDAGRLAVLEEIERRVLWLSAAIIDHANRVRPNPTGLKVGGHQASCASMTTLMTTLNGGRGVRPGPGGGALLPGADDHRATRWCPGRAAPDPQMGPVHHAGPAQPARGSDF